MNKLNSFKVTSSKTASKDFDTPINHIFVIDCSGSMYYDMPKIREQLKNKLPLLLKKEDTVSLVWFSGKDQFGTLVSKIHVTDLNDLKTLNEAIDRWLQVRGCTGFLQPLQTVKQLCNVENEVYSMMFLTDGHDNEWNRDLIVNASAELATLLSNAVFVEYGFYCDHDLLTRMATAVNGTVIFSENFIQYDPVFDGICKRKVTNKRIEIEVGKPVEDLVWSVSDEGAVTYKVENGKVYVPEDVEEVFWFTDSKETSKKTNWKALYQGLSVLALNRKADFVKKQLSDIGDVALYNQYTNAFSKQNLYDFASALRSAGADEKLRFREGKKVGLKPNENAYTVLNVLYDLKEGDAEIDLARMDYKRIGRATVMSDELSKAETAALSESIANSANVKEIKAHTDEAVRLAKERAQMKFVPKKNIVRINDFTYNETRPNVSMRVNIDGTVDLPSDAPSALPKTFPTGVYRNFTVVKDGIVNIPKLYVVISQALYDKFVSKGVPITCETEKSTSSASPVLFASTASKKCVIDLRSMPVINAKMVKSVSAQTLADTIYERMRMKAAQKVYKGMLDELVPPEKSVQIKAKYGDECAEYLKSVGITDSGFSPKTTAAPATDKYPSLEFVSKFNGLNTSVSFNALKKKLAEGKKLNDSDELLNTVYEECLKKQSSMPEKDFIEWLRTSLKNAKKQDAALYEKIIEDQFSLIVGQGDFTDNSVEKFTPVTSHGYSVEFELKDVVIDI